MPKPNGLEPKVIGQFDIDSGRSWLSIAISLKRIADVLTAAASVAVGWTAASVIGVIVTAIAQHH